MGSERRMFHQLLGDLDAVAACDLGEPLAEIASGTSCFGPHEEWNVWYHYLLGQLLPRSHEGLLSSLLESLINAFFALYPNGVQEAPYDHFVEDVLNTLGRCMMDSRCWDGDEIRLGAVLHRSNDNPRNVWRWWDASGDLSASMFLCLKYLPNDLVESWFESVLAIRSPHWRAQVFVWLVGANAMLEGRVSWPSEFDLEAYPSIAWEWSHCLRPDTVILDALGETRTESFLPRAARNSALSVVRRYFTRDTFREWGQSIARISYLEAELAAIPSTFEAMYVPRV